MIPEASVWYWLAVLGATVAAAVTLTLAWLDSPTGKERDRIDRREEEEE